MVRRRVLLVRRSLLPIGRCVSFVGDDAEVCLFEGGWAHASEACSSSLSTDRSRSPSVWRGSAWMATRRYGPSMVAATRTTPASASSCLTSVRSLRLVGFSRPARAERVLHPTRGSFHDDASVIDDRHALAQRVGFEHVVRRQQDGLALTLQVQDDLAQLACADRIEPDCGLVEEQHLRVVDQGPGDVQALHHAAGIPFDLLLGPIFRPTSSSRYGTRVGRHRSRNTGWRSSAGCPAGQSPIEPALAAQDQPDAPPHRLRLSCSTSCPSTVWCRSWG